MPQLIDKCILFICCCIFFLDDTLSVLPVFVFVTGIIISCFNTYFQHRRFTIMTTCIYIVVCIIFPYFCILLPLILYDVFEKKLYYLAVGSILVYLRFLFLDFQTINFLIPVFTAQSLLLCCRTKSSVLYANELKKIRDNSREINMLLENKNKVLLEKQDYEIHVATLKERNRIAREIHDNVGHLLSRSILQTGALIALNKDDTLNSSLLLMKDTLSSAMDNIRSSVHDLHDESIDLYNSIRTMLKDYDRYEKTLEYDMDAQVPKNIKYCFITILKEGLSNIVKHSDATAIEIIAREHPSFYQLLIYDNGHPTQTDWKNHGIGLENMQERVKSLHGTFRVITDNGFKIFISIPKEIDTE